VRRDSKRTSAEVIRGKARSASASEPALRLWEKWESRRGIPPSPFPLRVVGVAFMRPDLPAGSDLSEPLQWKGKSKRNPTLSVLIDSSCRGRIHATRFGDGLRFIGAPTVEGESRRGIPPSPY
jgi:hypothetical protein